MPRARGGLSPKEIAKLGAFHPTAAVGDTIGPAAIQDSGTIGCFARDAKTNAPVALTAMHVITDSVTPNKAMAFVSPSELHGGSAVMGFYLRGEIEGVDAAAIKLVPPIQGASEIPNIGLLTGWRGATSDDEGRSRVRLPGAVTLAKTGDVAVGTIVVASQPLPEIGLDDAILVDMPVMDGDSGAGLFDDDGFLLGLLKGHFLTGDQLAVFTPIAAALDRLGCWIP